VSARQKRLRALITDCRASTIADRNQNTSLLPRQRHSRSSWARFPKKLFIAARAATKLPGADLETGVLDQTLKATKDHGSNPSVRNPPGHRRHYALGQSKATRLATLNVRSRLDDARFGELVAMCIDKGIHALAVQEHRIHASDGIMEVMLVLPLGEGWFFHYQPCTPTGQGGVGIILSPGAHSALDSIKPVSNRLIVCQLSVRGRMSGLKVTLVCAYSPTSCRDSTDEATAFYDLLSEVISAVPLGHMLTVLGDLNATLQADGIRTHFTAPQPENANASRLAGLLQDHDLLAVNTLFRKRPHHLVTFYGPNSRRVCLDYVLCRKKWRSSYSDAHVFLPPIESDHRLLFVEFRWRFSSKRITPVVRYDVSLLRDKATADALGAAVMDILDGSDSSLNAESFSSAVAAASARVLPLRTRQVMAAPFRNHPDIVAARKEEAMMRDHCGRCEARPKLTDLYERKKVEYLLECSDVVVKSHQNRKHHAAYEAIRRMTGSNGFRPGCLIPADGPEERLELIRKGLASLYSESASSESDDTAGPFPFMVPASIDIEDGPIRADELEIAAGQLKFGKASDLSGMSAEVLKLPALMAVLLTIINAVFEGGVVPAAWLNSAMVLLFKKGDPSNLGNYRGITIIDLILKLYMKILLNRLADVLDPHLRASQNGFRRGRSTMQHILAVRRLIEETTFSSTGSLYLIFIDFRKAFDTVKWSAMWAILRAYRIPERIIAAIKAVYDSSFAQARTSDGLSGPFEFFAGVKQGCCLSPFLFVIMIDFVMRRAVDAASELGVQTVMRRSSRFPAQFVTDTVFADDVSLMSSLLDNVQLLFHHVVREAGLVGLVVSMPKTVLLAIGHPATSGDPVVSLNGEAIKVVQDAVFLGSRIRDSFSDFKIRRALAWQAMSRMKPIWESPSIPNGVKRRLFQTTIEPVLLYGCDTWTMSVEFEARLDGTYTRLLRHCLRVSYMDHWTNGRLYGDLPRITSVVRSRMLSFAGHCFRTVQPVSKVLFWKAPGPRKPGRRPMSYVDRIVHLTGATREELPTLMRDRVAWHATVRRAAPPEPAWTKRIGPG